PAGLDGAQTPASLGLARGRYVAVGYYVNPLLQQAADGVLAYAGPGETHAGVGVREPGAEGEGVDPGGDAEDGVAGDVADAVGFRHRPGDGAGDELALVDAGVIGAHAGVGHGDGAVEYLYLR